MMKRITKKNTKAKAKTKNSYSTHLDTGLLPGDNIKGSGPFLFIVLTQGEKSGNKYGRKAVVCSREEIIFEEISFNNYTFRID